jgi:hypothetical protein
MSHRLHFLDLEGDEFAWTHLHGPSQSAQSRCVTQYGMVVQKSIGEEEIRKHLPAALGGSCPIPPSAGAPTVNNRDVSAAVHDAAADKLPLKVESAELKDAMPEAGYADDDTAATTKRSRDTPHHDGVDEDGIDPTGKNARTQRESDSAQLIGTH